MILTCSLGAVLWFNFYTMFFFVILYESRDVCDDTMWEIIWSNVLYFEGVVWLEVRG